MEAGLQGLSPTTVIDLGILIEADPAITNYSRVMLRHSLSRHVARFGTKTEDTDVEQALADVMRVWFESEA